MHNKCGWIYVRITKVQFSGSIIFSIKGLPCFFPCCIWMWLSYLFPAYIFTSSSTSCTSLPTSHMNIQLCFSPEIPAISFDLIIKSTYENCSVQECTNIGCFLKVTCWFSSLDINIYFYFKQESTLQFSLIWLHICKIKCKANVAL